MRRALGGWLALFAMLVGAAGPAAALQATESTVKAAYLYKFVGYVEWPPTAFAQPDAPYVIGVAGADDVAAELERLVPGRMVNNRRLVVRRLREGESLRGLHLLFVGRGEANARALVRAAQQQGTLAVTEGESGLDTGSSINLVSAEDRVGFEVSLEAAERAGLRISSRMLSVARRVVPKA